MFLEKYVSPFYLNLIYDNYTEEFLEMLDEKNFLGVYKTLYKNGFYFMDDIILNYLELFEIDYKDVNKAIEEFKKVHGNDIINLIGKDMKHLNTIIEIALNEDDY